MRGLIVLLTVATGCAKDAVVWSEASRAAESRDRAAALSMPALDAAGRCAETVRGVRDARGAWYAAWWSPRPDSTAVLVVARSTDGRHWMPMVAADTADAGRTGCRRTPPSIAADSGSVHVAYAMTAREGAGVFVTHSMAGMPDLFHTPVAIVYGSFSGDATGRTAIAARGNTVAVAYEDPNSNPPRVGVALSTTMAHLFEWRGLVSPPTGSATDPAIELRGDTVLVSWSGASGRMQSTGIIRGTR